MLDLLLPQRCVLCRRQGAALCHACLVTLPPAPDLAPPPGFEAFAALLSYEGDARRLIAAIKFDHRRRALETPARVLAQLVDWPIDCVTWAPTSARHRRERGFDQSEVLARTVAAELHRPCVALLERTRHSGHQTGLGRSERLRGPAFAPLRARGRRPCAGSVLLVDDIRTTGATLCAAGDALLEAGATAVSGVTLAVTL